MGPTLERIKYGAYVIYAVVFASIIYPIGSHWVFGGGWLQNGDTPLLPTGMQDFAGSTAVHLIGATGALAALLLLGPRKGKYGPDGQPRAIPGHSMPLAGLGVLILFVGWFGFNPGSTLGIGDTRMGDVAVITLLATAGGVLGAFVATQIKQRTIDIGMVANGAIAGLVGITAPSGYVEVWAGPIIGFVAGLLVVFGIIWIDKKIDDPWAPSRRTAWPVSGARSRAGCSRRRGWPSTTPSAIRTVASSTPENSPSWWRRRVGLTVGIRVRVRDELRHLLRLIRKTIGLRVSEEQEVAGLDIVEMGCTATPSSSSRSPRSRRDHEPASGAPVPTPVTASVTKEATA